MAVVLFDLRVDAQTNAESFSFTKRDLALPVQRAGMFVGQSGGALIVGGGLGENGQPSAEVFVKANSGWKRLVLDEPVAFGGFVSGTFAEKLGGFSKLFVAGGLGTNGLTDKVFSLELRGDRLVQIQLPRFPKKLRSPVRDFLKTRNRSNFTLLAGRLR